MSGKNSKPPSLEKIRRDINAVWFEICVHQLEVFASMSLERKAALTDDAIRTGRMMVFTTERAANPDLSDVEIHKRAIARFMRFSEWEPEVREGFIRHMDRVLPKYYAEKAARENKEANSENDLP